MTETMLKVQNQHFWFSIAGFAVALLKFLHDGDQIILRGYFERDGCARIGMGECTGRIVSNSPG